MKTEQLKPIIEISGIVLTKKAIERLKTLQDGNNELLKDSERIIADAICLILQNFESFTGDEKETVTNLLEEMAIVRHNIDDLASPEDEKNILATTFHS